MAKAISPVLLFFILTAVGLDKFHMRVFLAIMVRALGNRGSELHETMVFIYTQNQWSRMTDSWCCVVQ